MFGFGSKDDVPLHGDCAPAFGAVREAFERNFREAPELGAAVCVFHRGEKVVDLWGGHIDRKRTRPWQNDTAAVTFSATKGIVALAFLMLHDRGALDYDALVSSYWPEFRGDGKEHITVRTLINHRAGLSALDHKITLDNVDDREVVHAAMIAQAPLWEPGSAQGYHALTFGLYTAELFQRITGETLGTFIRREIAEPLGVCFHLGLRDPQVEVAPVIPPSAGTVIAKVLPTWLFGNSDEHRLYRAAFKKSSITGRTFARPEGLGKGGFANYNLPRVHAMELPFGNAIGTARALATIYNMMVQGGTADTSNGPHRFFDSALVTPLIERQSYEVDLVLRKPLGWSQGFLKDEVLAKSPEGFGHAGTGGNLGWAAPERALSFGYVMNQLDHKIRSPRCLALLQAAYACTENA